MLLLDKDKSIIHVIEMYSLYYRDCRDPVLNLAVVTERRWDKIEKQLQHLTKEVEKLTGTPIDASSSLNSRSTNSIAFNDLVIEMDPEHAALGVQIMAQKLAQNCDVYFATHQHSSLKAKLPGNLWDFWPSPSDPNKSRLDYQLCLTLIWKPVGCDAVLKLSSTTKATPVMGEVNVLRYLSRMTSATSKLYEDAHGCAWIDQQLDSFHEFLHLDCEDSRAKIWRAKEIAKCQRPRSLEATVTLADIMFTSVAQKCKEVEPVLKSQFVSVSQHDC